MRDEDRDAHFAGSHIFPQLPEEVPHETSYSSRRRRSGRTSHPQSGSRTERIRSRNRQQFAEAFAAWNPASIRWLSATYAWRPKKPAWKSFALRRQAYDPATALLTAYPPSREWVRKTATEKMRTKNRILTEETGPDKFRLVAHQTARHRRSSASGRSPARTPRRQATPPAQLCRATHKMPLDAPDVTHPAVYVISQSFRSVLNLRTDQALATCCRPC
jgi:hypothetical protein